MHVTFEDSIRIDSVINTYSYDVQHAVAWRQLRAWYVVQQRFRQHLWNMDGIQRPVASSGTTAVDRRLAEHKNPKPSPLIMIHQATPARQSREEDFRETLTGEA